LLKEAQGKYKGPKFDHLYERWRNGSLSDCEIKQFSDGSLQQPRGLFRTLVYSTSLKVFADPLTNQAESCLKPSLASSVSQVSASGSAEVSGS